MNIAVIGAGAWGTAFSIHLSRLGHTVTLVPRRFEHALALSSARENKEYLPGIALPPSIQLGHEVAPVLMEADAVLLACPSHALRETCRLVQKERYLATQLRLAISLSKGLENESYQRPSQVIAQELPHVTTCALTGPTNAAEVAHGRPAAMVLAVPRIDETITELQAALSGPTLRVYTTEDIAGAEYGGCLKNIYAIAAGCADGLNLGDNAKAALLTRALTELVRVGQALGAKAETFYGLSGFGDLTATCYGQWSRNREFGFQLGQGKSVDELLRGRKTIVEGYRSTQAFAGLCQERQIDAPILRETHAMLFEGKKAADVLASLMGRGLKRES